MGFHHRLGNYHQQSPYPNFRRGANYRNFALAGLAFFAVAVALISRVEIAFAFVAVVLATQLAVFARFARFLITQTKLNAPRHILRP